MYKQYINIEIILSNFTVLHILDADPLSLEEVVVFKECMYYF